MGGVLSFDDPCSYSIPSEDACKVSDCAFAQAKRRALIVYSNLAFVAPVLSLLVLRYYQVNSRGNVGAERSSLSSFLKRVVRTISSLKVTDWSFILAFINTTAASSLYHACDVSEYIEICNTTRMCALGTRNARFLYYADMVSSGVAMHLSLLLGFSLDSKTQQIYNQVVLMLFPVYALYLIPGDTNLFVFSMMALGVVDVSLRLYTKEFFLIDKIGVALLFTSVVLVLFANFLQLATFLKAPNGQETPYYVAHSLWHILLGLGAALLSFVLGRPALKTTNQHYNTQQQPLLLQPPNASSYIKLNPTV